MNCNLCTSDNWKIVLPCCQKTICLACFAKQRTSKCPHCEEPVFRTLPPYWFKMTHIPVIE